ncbi:uncharacterized protein [Leuresthes tenuis]|uniref:uncharacterized protein n=1 Tax=Leuresthes tenuis TaxID=355514 RepID=UPI003B50AE49
MSDVGLRRKSSLRRLRYVVVFIFLSSFSSLSAVLLLSRSPSVKEIFEDILCMVLCVGQCRRQSGDFRQRGAAASAKITRLEIHLLLAVTFKKKKADADMRRNAEDWGCQSSALSSPHLPSSAWFMSVENDEGGSEKAKGCAKQAWKTTEILSPFCSNGFILTILPPAAGLIRSHPKISHVDAPDGEGKASDRSAPIGDELDIFGPMVSNPLPPSNTQQAQSGSSTAPPQMDSTTSTTATTKAEEKKLLSKDSILSLYASSSVSNQPQSQQQHAAGQAGVYMGQPQMQFTPQGFPPAMAGGMPPTTMMGGGSVMSGMTLPNGSYVGMQQQGMLPANQGQNMYNMQQGQWNMSQMTQQMSGMALSSAGPTAGTFSQPGAPTASWSAAPAPASGQTLSTQLWK